MGSIPILLTFGEPGAHPPAPEVPLDIDSEDLPEALAERGYEFIDLDVPPYTARLFVNQDATFIVDGYEELRSTLRQHAAEAHHYVFLGDGEIVVKARISADRVECEISNCPQLDRRNLVVTLLDVSRDAYVYGWWRAVEQLFAVLASPGAAES